MKVRIMLILSVLVASLLLFGCTRIVSAPVSEDKPYVPIVTVVEKTLTGATSVAVPQQGESHWIVLESSRFMPRDVEVRVGDTVEWVSKNDETYIFRLADLVEARLSPGARAEYTFTAPGQFAYSGRLVDNDEEDRENDPQVIRGTVFVH